jgi:ABC-type taurine transport system substrate-binding protein
MDFLLKDQAGVEEGENRMKYSRHWVHIALLEALTLFFFSAITAGDIWAEETPKELVIGYQAIPNTQTVVKEMGWHEKELGIPIKWVKYDSGLHGNKALASSSVDIGLVGTSPTAAAISQGIPIEVIWIHDIIGARREGAFFQSSVGGKRVGGATSQSRIDEA